MSAPTGYVVRGKDERRREVFADADGDNGYEPRHGGKPESIDSVDAACFAKLEIEAVGCTDVAIFRVHADGTETPILGYEEALRDLAERTAERDVLAATVERLIREAGAVRLDERQRAKAEHDGALESAHQHALNRADQLERDNARLRCLVTDADRVKDENETLLRDLASTRAELKALHDVLSGAKKLTK